MAYELRPFGVTVVSVWPRLTLTEQVAPIPEVYDHRKATQSIFNPGAWQRWGGPEPPAQVGPGARDAELAQEYRIRDPEPSLGA